MIVMRCTALPLGDFKTVPVNGAQAGFNTKQQQQHGHRACQRSFVSTYPVHVRIVSALSHGDNPDSEDPADFSARNTGDMRTFPEAPAPHSLRSGGPIARKKAARMGENLFKNEFVPRGSFRKPPWP